MNIFNKYIYVALIVCSNKQSGYGQMRTVVESWLIKNKCCKRHAVTRINRDRCAHQLVGHQPAVSQ